MFASFDVSIDDKSMFDGFYDSGLRMFNQHKSTLESELEEFIIDNEVLDGDSISRKWFPSVNADVFISHSHMDEEFVIAFAGWLKEKFNITAFVDSCVWGYSNDLQKILDDKYCRNNIHSYSYEKRNVSTSHVHMMLNVALMKMIDNCECLFFVNTPNSLPIKNSIEKSDSTLSPWIFSEVEISRCLRRLSPRRFVYKSDINAGTILEHFDLKVQYRINTDHMKKINKSHLMKWLYNNSTSMHPLDVLYEQEGIITEAYNE